MGGKLTYQTIAYTPSGEPTKPASPMTLNVAVRPLRITDVAAAVAIHRVELSTEFLSRCGVRFLRSYYCAWIESPGAIALVALDGDEVVGVVLGATDPAGHVQAMVRRRGLRIVGDLALHAALHPTFARELVVTRLTRYVGGVGRLIRRRLRQRTTPPIETPSARTGEITHVFVSAARQGQGIGRALLAASEEVARRTGVATLELVTPPDQAARRFYERLGWIEDGEMTSRSGELFVRFHRDVSVADDSH